MNSKILVALMIIGIASTVAGAGTYAYFTDTETSTGNTFTAGNLDVSISGHENQEFPVSFNNLEPGVIVGPKKLLLRNTGSLTEMIDGIRVSGLTENDKKIIKRGYGHYTAGNTVSEDIKEFYGGYPELEIDYGSQNAIYKLTLPEDFVIGTEDNVAFTWDSDNDDEADFQISWHATKSKHYNGYHWGYKDVSEGSWSAWQGVPSWLDKSKSGKVITIKVPLEKLGDSNSEYKFGMNGFYQHGSPFDNPL
ncbi:MAG: TasA family protein, partial [Candidatus Aenigmatarchaeota archaeon]